MGELRVYKNLIFSKDHWMDYAQNELKLSEEMANFMWENEFQIVWCEEREDY